MFVFSRLRFLCFLLLSFCAAAQAAEYVGTETCIGCHEQQYKEWQGSHHDMAMRHAAEDSVLGDFNDVTFEFAGKPNRFYRKGEEYWVNIEGPDGKFHDYQIKYTFGYWPLQQYMVEFDDGRVQLIPYTWDSRDASEGGQRWYHLYPDHVDNHDEFYWTNTGQNWNYMCADCHSTDLRKNYDASTDTYNTTWEEINVGCEACHGQASDHLAWANTEDKESVPNHARMGFSRDIGPAVEQWLSQEGSGTLVAEEIKPTQQVLMCAQCHSRRTQISENDHVAANDFNHRYLLSLITDALYYPDGQIYDEDYVYGSFLQSKMHRAGVTCSNCHNPHTAQVKMPKEVVCLQCHEATTYASESHHFHPVESEGGQCTSCHMPETLYMQVDWRADHAWHVPRPDLALQTGTRDICLDCHEDKDSNWSLSFTRKWYPNSPIQAEEHFALGFAAADAGIPEAANMLSKTAQNKNNANIIRASALDRMRQLPNRNTLIAIARAVREPDSNLKIGAISGAFGLPGNERWRIIAPLLNDPTLAVRTQAVQALVPLWPNLNQQQQTTLQPAIDEYFTVLAFNADRGYSHTNKGNTLTHQGKYQEAEQAYDAGIKVEPYFSASYLNKADLYRRQGMEDKVISTLRQGIEAQPEDGNLPYSLGLAYFRMKDEPQARQYLQQATEVAPQNANFHYVYGLSLEKSDPTKAQQSLQTAWQVSGNPQHLYALCEVQIRQKAFNAKQCLQQLSKVVPPQVVDQLRQQMR